MVTKETVLGLAKDNMADFLYYGRKVDEEVPIGKIEEAVKAGVVSVEDILSTFEVVIRESVARS